MMNSQGLLFREEGALSNASISSPSDFLSTGFPAYLRILLRFLNRSIMYCPPCDGICSIDDFSTILKLRASCNDSPLY